jgi:hypothetical protein
MAERLCGFPVLALRIEKVAVEVPRIQAIGCDTDGLFEVFPGFGRIAKADGKAGNTVVQNAEARRGSGVERRRIDAVGLLEDVTGLLGEAQRREGTGERSPFAGENTVPDQGLGLVWVFGGDGVRLRA